MAKPQVKKAAVIQQSIRRILYHDWNPIGFAGLLPLDEYDSCIAPVYRILASTRSEQELIDLLLRMESDFNGSTSDATEQLRHVARNLLQLDVGL